MRQRSVVRAVKRVVVSGDDRDGPVVGAEVEVGCIFDEEVRSAGAAVVGRIHLAAEMNRREPVLRVAEAGLVLAVTLRCVVCMTRLIAQRLTRSPFIARPAGASRRRTTPGVLGSGGSTFSERASFANAPREESSDASIGFASGAPSAPLGVGGDVIADPPAPGSIGPASLLMFGESGAAAPSTSLTAQLGARSSAMQTWNIPSAREIAMLPSHEGHDPANRLSHRL